MNTCIQHWFGFPVLAETLLDAIFDPSKIGAAGITVKHTLAKAQACWVT